MKLGMRFKGQLDVRTGIYELLVTMRVLVVPAKIGDMAHQGRAGEIDRRSRMKLAIEIDTFQIGTPDLFARSSRPEMLHRAAAGATANTFFTGRGEAPIVAGFRESKLLTPERAPHKSILFVHTRSCMSENATRKPAERRRGSGAQLVYDVLRDEILALVLAPGSPIDEIQLAKRLSMSRTPIREAMVRLAGEGLVTTLPNRSTVVANIDFLNLPAFFDAITLMYRVTTRLAALHHLPDDLVTIRAHQAEFARAVKTQDALAMIATNRDFHAAIAVAGRNPYYESLFLRLLDEGRRLLRLYYSSFNDRLPQRYVVEHEDMIAAIEARDMERADKLAGEHADQIVAQIRSMIARDQRQNISL